MTTLHTPAMNLPYPDGSERVMDGDNAIGALATSIDVPLGKLWTPPGVVVGGPARTMTATTEKMPLATVLSGTAAMFNDASDQIVVTAGNGGLYLIWVWGQATIPTAGGFLRVGIRTGGATPHNGTNVATATGATSYFSASGALYLAENGALSVWVDAGTGNLPTVTVNEFGFVRLGSSYGTLLRGALGGAELEPLPAPEEPAPAPKRSRRK